MQRSLSSDAVPPQVERPIEELLRVAREDEADVAAARARREGVRRAAFDDEDVRVLRCRSVEMLRMQQRKDALVGGAAHVRSRDVARVPVDERLRKRTDDGGDVLAHPTPVAVVPPQNVAVMQAVLL